MGSLKLDRGELTADCREMADIFVPIFKKDQDTFLSIIDQSALLQ